MMEPAQLWELTRQAWAAIVEQYDPVFDRYVERNWLEPWSLGLLLAALSFEPEAISAARLAVRGPYTADDTYRSRLVDLAGRGFLAEAEPGAYRLSSHGRAELESVMQDGYQAMAAADPLKPRDSQWLTEMLLRLVRACLEAPPPPEPWSISLSFKLMPGADLRLPVIEQAITCLSSYRDDAHLAAWRPSGLSPTALECLTLLWREQAAGLSQLFERLANRGHPLSEYARALEELRQRGYLSGPDEAPQLTAAGRAFREQVEGETDRMFYAPWSCLAEDDHRRLAELLVRLQEGLNKRRP
jgi:hypothetical protein